MKEVPVLRYSHLSPAKKRTYATATNKIAEHSQWDKAVLAHDFILFPEVDIDARDLGFPTVESDDIICDLNDEADAADWVMEPETEQRPITKPGEMWLAGEHVLLCATWKPEGRSTGGRGQEEQKLYP